MYYTHTSTFSVVMQTYIHKHLRQQTRKYKHMLTVSHTRTQTQTHTHTVISMLWHSALRAAEEYDEYVFGTEQRDEGEEGIERKSREKEGWMRGGKRGEEVRDRVKEKDVPNDFRN